MIPEEKRREILLIIIQPILSSAPVAMRKKKKTLRFSIPGSRCDAEPGFICTGRGGRCAGRGGGGSCSGVRGCMELEEGVGGYLWEGEVDSI